jgi:hypothetical protein
MRMTKSRRSSGEKSTEMKAAQNLITGMSNRNIRTNEDQQFYN